MINLLPPEHKENLRYGRKNARYLKWLSTLAFGVVMLILVSGVGRLTIQAAKSSVATQKEALETQIAAAQLSETEAEYTGFINGLQGVKKLYQKQVIYSRLITKLGTLLPSGSRITNISLTDTDKAITLNFNNTVDNLGPVIQVNLENQGEQIAKNTRTIIPQGFGIAIGGPIDKLSSSTEPVITVNSSDKSIQYYVNIKSQEDEKRLTAALKNGGEFSYNLIKQPLTLAGFIDKQSTASTLVDYKVDTNNRRVDFTFSATNLTDIENAKKVILSSPNTLFKEVYVFEDRSYTDNNCTSAKPNSKCGTICSNGRQECTTELKVCSTAQARGCQYVVRAYYDELYTSGSITKLDAKEQQTQCDAVCTHQVKASYTQLFDKVDINRVVTCVPDPSAGGLSCPVEIRAELSNSAKFYLINTGASK